MLTARAASRQLPNRAGSGSGDDGGGRAPGRGVPGPRQLPHRPARGDTWPVPGLGRHAALAAPGRASKRPDLITTGRPVSPDEAKELGIVDQVLDDGAACRAAAVEYCGEAGGGPQLHRRHDRR
jgi:hypothetical protein